MSKRSRKSQRGGAGRGQGRKPSFDKFALFAHYRNAFEAELIAEQREALDGLVGEVWTEGMRELAQMRAEHHDNPRALSGLKLIFAATTERSTETFEEALDVAINTKSPLTHPVQSYETIGEAWAARRRWSQRRPARRAEIDLKRVRHRAISAVMRTDFARSQGLTRKRVTEAITAIESSEEAELRAAAYSMDKFL